MADFTIGAQLYSVRQFTKTIEGVRETLEKVARIGYRCVQVSGFGPVDMAEVARICRDNGLDVGSTHTGWNRFTDSLDELIEEHQVLGCRHPAIGGLPGDYRSADGVRRFLDELGPIAARLSEVGMDFSYHNHNHELARVNGETWLGMVCRESSPDVLKMELDTYWIQAGGGDPAEWIRRCAGREPVVHFKDMCVTPEREQRFAEIGEGNLNWPAIIEACRQGGVEYAMIEQDNCYDRDPFESLGISYRNLVDMGLK
ncbi:MAG: sugar phosphate isomerase/epimerase [Candidatus Brocadiaceae bacterium]|nr:sugar phosphate isomerase/epimerase [Candidatus Brocadiaceae bacterium]